MGKRRPEPKCNEKGLLLATYSLMEVRKMSYEKLKFLCDIWGIPEIFKKYCVPYKFNKGNYQGCKEEIVVILRQKMRQEDNRRRAYQEKKPHITTPESIRPIRPYNHKFYKD